MRVFTLLFFQAILFAFGGSLLYAQGSKPRTDERAFDSVADSAIVSVLQLNTVDHCEHIKGKYPIIRFRTPTFRYQVCFRDPAEIDKVVTISFYDQGVNLITPFAFIIERALGVGEDGIEYGAYALYINEGAYERGVRNDVWRLIVGEDLPDDMEDYFADEAPDIFEKLRDNSLR